MQHLFKPNHLRITLLLFRLFFQFFLPDWKFFIYYWYKFAVTFVGFLTEWKFLLAHTKSIPFYSFMWRLLLNSILLFCSILIESGESWFYHLNRCWDYFFMGRFQYLRNSFCLLYNLLLRLGFRWFEKIMTIFHILWIFILFFQYNFLSRFDNIS